MRWCFSRPLWAVLFVSFSAAPGFCQPQAAPTLRQAVDAAWVLTPQARALNSRQAELDAREKATASWIAGPPSLSLAHRTDRVGSNGGLRESEAEISAPLWSPGVRRVNSAQIAADRAALDQQQLLAKLKLTAEIREAAAQAALAQIERDLAGAKLRDAQRLASDVERRVKAGEVARVDLLQAMSVQHQASAAQAQADGAHARAMAHWRALTGLQQAAPVDEALGGATQEHPASSAARTQLRAAQAKLASTQADRRDPIEVGVGMVRERDAFGTQNETSLKLSLRIPLGSYGRNAPKLAAAQADVDTAEAEAQAVIRTLEAEQDAARAEVEIARRTEQLATERARASGEIHALIANAYRLGEGDLPTRLRAEGERFESELALAKARLETRRAIAKLNQALGILP